MSLPSRKSFDTVKFTTNLQHIFIQPIEEIVYGIKFKTIPLAYCLALGIIFQILFLSGIDFWIFKKLGLIFLYPKNTLKITYTILGSFSGFFLWSYLQVLLRIKLIKKLTEVFANSGLQNTMGKYPSFVFDRPVDEFSRRMRLTRNNFPIKTFIAAKDFIASGLSIFIDEIKEDRTRGTVDLIYSHTELTKEYKIDDLQGWKKDTFIIGKSRGPLIECNFRDVPHLLIAGQTGGGKSTFLRQFITGLYLNNPKYQFTLIDLKGGLEFQTFEGLENIRVTFTVAESITLLASLANQLIEKRKSLFKANEVKDLDAFRKIPKKDIVYPDGVAKDIKLDRQIIIVDEASDLFMAGAFAGPQEVKEARRNASRIAAQGRAVGVHIIIATQRPDRFAVDPQTKANLVGILCFRQPNQATSRTVLDNSRAHDLPNIKGRGIWKSEEKLLEVQTPLFTEEEAKKLLAPHSQAKETQATKKQSFSSDLLYKE